MGESSVSAALSAEVQHACPRCRSAIELTDGGGVCSACGFKVTLTKGIYCFLGQAETVNEWQNTYEDLASGPLGNTSTADEYRSPIQHRYIIAAFRRVCGAIPPNARILDVGCGNGIFWESLLGGPRAIGIDYSLSMCVLARARKLLAYQANALALPFADEQFDLIYSAEMLQLIDDLPALFAELARVCRPGGRIVVSTLNAASLLRRVLQAARKLRPHPAATANPPAIKRTAEEICIATRRLPLELDIACWTHFPFPWMRCQASTRNMLAWAASNVVVSFVKKSSG
jgi:SAM-dependent methyltransferase